MSATDSWSSSFGMVLILILARNGRAQDSTPSGTPSKTCVSLLKEPNSQPSTTSLMLNDELTTMTNPLEILTTETTMGIGHHVHMPTSVAAGTTQSRSLPRLVVSLPPPANAVSPPPGPTHPNPVRPHGLVIGSVVLVLVMKSLGCRGRKGMCCCVKDAASSARSVAISGGTAPFGSV